MIDRKWIYLYTRFQEEGEFIHDISVGITSLIELPK